MKVQAETCQLSSDFLSRGEYKEKPGGISVAKTKRGVKTGESIDDVKRTNPTKSFIIGNMVNRVE